VATAAAAPKNKDLRQLLERELKDGYTLKAARGGHFQLLGPDGKVVREEGKPVMIANTPGDRRATSNTRAMFKRLDVLAPKRTPKRAEREHSVRPDLAGKSREEQRDEAKERAEKTDKLREEMAPWIKQLGGWEARGLKADVAAILAKRSPEAFGSVGSASQAILNFTKGNSVSDRVRAAMYDLHDLFKDEDDVRGVYVDLVRENRGIGSSLGPVELKPGQEWPFDVQLLELEKLFNDYSYQRPVHETFVRQLVMNFDERLVGVIDVSKRGNGEYAILDGQQRTETMKQRGKTKCFCAVYEGMSVAAEAQFFFHKNKDRKGMSAYYGFRAKALAGDEKAIAVDKITKQFGFVMGPVTDNNLQIGAVRAIEDVYEFDTTDVRENALPPTLKVIKESWLGRKGSLDAEIIRGLGRFFRAYRDDQIEWDHWTEALAALGPLLVIGRARDFSGATEQRGHGKSMASTLVEIHNTGLPMAKRLPLKQLDSMDQTRQKRTTASTLAA
jgi:hypothetical protein